MDLGGEGEAQRRARGGQVGEMGGGRGVGAALSPPGVGAGEVVGRGRAPVATPVGGTGGKATRGGAGPDQLEWAEARARHCALGPVHSGLCFYTFVLFSIFIFFLYSFLFYLF